MVFYPMYLQFELNKLNSRFNGTVMKAASRTISNGTSGQFQEYAYEFLSGMSLIISLVDDAILSMNDDRAYELYLNETRELYLELLLDRIAFIYIACEKKDFYIQYANEYWKATQEHILKIWRSIEQSPGTTKPEGVFIKVFDDLFNTTIKKFPDVMQKNLSDFHNLHRASKYRPLDSYPYIMPDPTYSKENRWNDDGVAFLYLSYDNDNKSYQNVTMAQKTCFEETRFSEGQSIAVCKFQSSRNDARILDFTHKDLELNDLFIDLKTPPANIKQETMQEIIKNPSLFNRLTKLAIKQDQPAFFNEIQKIHKKLSHDKQIKDYVMQRTPLLILGNICDAIFYAVDKISDPTLEAYISFRKFSKYLMSKGIDGVAYRSTRMDMLGLNGYCLTLFDPKDARPVMGSMEAYKYDSGTYELLKKY